MRTITGLICLSLTFTVGCRSAKTQGTVETVNPHIRGKIMSISVPDVAPESNLLRILHVEGIKESDTTYDKAHVRIITKTDIQKKEGAEMSDASAGDLKRGATVEVWFQAPVAESYPVQATASRVVVIESGSAK
jgi:beta-N-acetylhexosaminidase